MHGHCSRFCQCLSSMCSSFHAALPFSHIPDTLLLLVQAYSSMDSVARLALAAICRSCHVRLRSDTFASILDDSPMLRGVVSSSTLHAMQHINNFLLRDQLGDKWTMAMSQDGLKSRGFMTVIAAKDTRQGVVPHVCKMQVTRLLP